MASPDPLDYDAVSPSSRYSSCGESEFDRYCSANSVMGTPSTICGSSNAITRFNDFSEIDFTSNNNNGFENFTLGGTRPEMNNLIDRKLIYGSSGLELYGDCSDELAITTLDSSELLGFNRLVDSSEVEACVGSLNNGDCDGSVVGNNGNCDGSVESLNNGNCVFGDVEVGGLTDGCGSDGGESKNESFWLRSVVSVHYGKEMEGRSKNSLVMNSSNGNGDGSVDNSERCVLGDIHGAVFSGPLRVEVGEREGERGDHEGLSDFQHSEGEDSTYGYGSDGGESKSESFWLRRSVHNGKEPEGRSENPLVMNSINGNGDGSVGNSERCVLDGVDGVVFSEQLGVEVGEREGERGEDEGLSNFQHSEGEDSMYGYGSDGGESKNESFLLRSVHYGKELEARNENPLVINSSVAFGSEDLEDFLLQNEGFGQGPVMSDLFCKKQERDYQLQEDTMNSGYVSIVDFASAGRGEEGKAKEDMVAVHENVEEIKDIGEAEGVKEVRDIPTASCCQVQRAEDELTENVTESAKHASADFLSIVRTQVQGADMLVDCAKTSITNAYKVNPLPEGAPQHVVLNATDGGSMEKRNQYISSAEDTAISDSQYVKNPELGNTKFKFDHFSDSRVDQNSSSPLDHVGNINGKAFENLEQIVLPLNVGTTNTLESSSTSTDLIEKSPVIPKTEDFELNEFHDEVVQEMEEILLDSMDSPGARLAMGSRFHEPQLSVPLRDGGMTASTSSTDDAYLLGQRPRRIDRIEVVGARQKKGDVSFSERLVGVKEYTVYRIKVWSGEDQWEVERRYRDFLTFYRSMKTLFTEQGWILPLPWSSVEKESQIFRSSSPDIISKRSVLIQECLQSSLRTRFFSSPPRALVWFLSPQDSHTFSPMLNSPVSQSSVTGGENLRTFSTLGKTISLIVEIPPNKSVKQLLEAQHYTCAGCHKHFDDGKTLIWDFVQTLGWGKPRLCEYTGQLFCSSCHANETAVLPARVLHHWDFTHYPVSQMAKSYLDSIHEQPMLCVTAVNPFLLSKVPALLHVMSVRKKIGIMLPYVRCPFRRSINSGLGSRRYLLESNDFFALRDLIDLSKGVFAALPVMVETVSRKILEHITDRCLICCDVGDPCGARQDCSDPSSLIFPFQEDDIERCKACQSVFHKRCFRKLTICHCGAQLRLNETKSLTNRASQRGSGETRGTLDLLGRGLGSGLSSKFFSVLFTKQKLEKKREHKDENIILMGSLPSTSL